MGSRARLSHAAAWVNGLLIAASLLIVIGLAMLWAPGPGWAVLLAGVTALLVALAARATTRN